MTTQRVILVSCGSFNPPTIMHLRIFELARDYLHRHGGYQVIGGVISPVHDGYGKDNLTKGEHRIQMSKLATLDSWIKVSEWEIKNNSGWTRTRPVLDFHQSRIDGYLNGTIKEKDTWMPDSLTVEMGSDGVVAPVKLKLLCGADVLESFNIPKLWNNEDMSVLSRNYGLVVISREGNDPQESIYKNDILTESEGNVLIVREWIANDISSTRIRRAIRRGHSIRYLVPDQVVDYIKKENLYK